MIIWIEIAECACLLTMFSGFQQVWELRFPWQISKIGILFKRGKRSKRQKGERNEIGLDFFYISKKNTDTRKRVWTYSAGTQ